jgi:hypothetical protein
MQAVSILTVKLRQPMTPALPVAKRKLRHIAVSWAAGAGYYLLFVVTEAKAQGCVDNLVCGGSGESARERGRASQPFVHTRSATRWVLDWIARVFLLLLLFGKEFEYFLSVRLTGHVLK